MASVLAGVLVAYGAFAVLAALVGTVAAAIGLNTDLNRNDWSGLGVGSAIAVAVVLLLAYLFGGYVAGRMARRAVSGKYRPGRQGDAGATRLTNPATQESTAERTSRLRRDR